MNTLIIADSFTNSDMFYATKVLIPDHFIYLKTKSSSYILVNKLEFERIKKEAQKNITVLQLEDYIKKAEQKFNNINLAAPACLFLKEKNISQISIPATFPALYADFLRKQKIKLNIEAPLIKKRIIKTQEEIKEIKSVQRIAEKAFNHIIKIIKKAKIKNNCIYHKNKKLTSEYLKEQIREIFILHNIESPEDMIISSGKDTAYPHKTGSGTIKPYTPIIIDIFPRSLKSRYFTDMTRTVCKGRPKNPKIQEIYNLVLKAQNEAYKKIKPNVAAQSIHNAVLKTFKKHNMEKYFIHSTGHGVGIDIHEFPSISLNSKAKLKPGMIITNEPGLYIQDIGGVRLEDILLVTKTGCKNLTKLPKRLII